MIGVAASRKSNEDIALCVCVSVFVFIFGLNAAATTHRFHLIFMYGEWRRVRVFIQYAYI